MPHPIVLPTLPLYPRHSNDTPAVLQPQSSSQSIRPQLVTNNRSFLSKLIPSTPRIPSFRRARAATLRLQRGNALGILMIKVLAVKGMSQRKVDHVEPLVSIRYGTFRTEMISLRTLTLDGETKTRVENAVEAKLELTVYDDGSLGREGIEIVIKDKVGEYLGELSLFAKDDWWGSSETWIGGVPPVNFYEDANMPIWHSIKSSDPNVTAAGSLLIKIGFLPASSTGSFSKPVLLDPVQRNSIIVALKNSEDETEGSRRASREESVLLNSPLEGVGTIPIHRVDSVSTMPIIPESHDPTYPEDSASSSDEDGYLSADGSESGDEAEEGASETEDERAIEDRIAEVAQDLGAAHLDSSTTLVSPEVSPSPPLLVVTPATSHASRKGLSLPQFMKRHSSARSITNDSDSTSDMIRDDSESASAGQIASGREGMKARMNRFTRKKRLDERSSDVTGEVGEELKPKRRKGLRRRITGEVGNRLSSTGLVRRKTKRDYRLAEDSSIFGIVQIEIKSAHRLPRLHNMTRTGFDMDPFVVISCGKTVARTRVVRHSLNPVFDEKLAFHIGRTESESGFSVVFNVFDWDQLSSNDHVGDAEFALQELIALSIAPDDRGVYPSNPDGRLKGDDFHEMSLKINVVAGKEGSAPSGEGPVLIVRAKFTPYDALRQQFWRCYLPQYDIDESGSFSQLEIVSALDSLNSTLATETIQSFFSRFNKTADEELTTDELVICLEQELLKPMSEKRIVDETLLPDSGISTPLLSSHNASHEGLSGNTEEIGGSVEMLDDPRLKELVRTDRSHSSSEATTSSDPPVEMTSNHLVERIINIRECPVCHRQRLHSKDDLDIITHLANCSSLDPAAINRVVVGSYVTATQAHQKWFLKLLKVATQGAYSIGANSSNIIVQDRRTGMVQEEKMATYVRLGMRLAYRGGLGGGMEGPRVRRMLESMTIKQGAKYNSPASVSEIIPFIRFHRLDMDEVLEPLSSFKTFNEFFYRKLKPNARPIPDDPSILVSPADARAVAFESIAAATTLWVKGRGFSIETLLGPSFKEQAPLFAGGSVLITRLAPQDYHRFHSPVDGVCGRIEKISGKYYTVNPVAIRSSLDVFGENVRVVMPIYSPVFGEVMNIWVGAMMVGSVDISVKEGDQVKRGQDIGWFSFGGSTVLTILKPGVVRFDEDLLTNSKVPFETLIRCGTRVGVAI